MMQFVNHTLETIHRIHNPICRHPRGQLPVHRILATRLANRARVIRHRRNQAPALPGQLDHKHYWHGCPARSETDQRGETPQVQQVLNVRKGER